MQYTEFLTYISSFTKLGGRLGFENCRVLMDRLGAPDRSLKFVHISGTNGKGSISKMTESILTESGYKVGLFVSPYIIDFRERIQISGEMISEQDVCFYADKVKPIVDEMMAEGYPAPCEFEVIQAIGMLYFAEKQCDIVCMEAGIGGERDSTNIIDTPLVSVIANIGLDHTALLGDTVEQIATDKCGIIKGNITVAYPQSENIINIIKNKCVQKCSKLIIPDVRDLNYLSSDWMYSEFCYKGVNYTKKLVGEYQIYNASVSIEVAKSLSEFGYNVTEESIRKGIAKANFPARLEVMSTRPLVIVDGSHNVQGAETVSNVISSLSDKKVTVVVGMMADKDCRNAVNLLTANANRVLTVNVDYYRSISSENLAEMIENGNVEVCDDAIDTVISAIDNMSDEDVLIVCGSLYLASSVRKSIVEYFNQK